eukprot:jgi/Tetstr1/465414/TSEL_010098.t1
MLIIRRSQALPAVYLALFCISNDRWGGIVLAGTPLEGAFPRSSRRLLRGASPAAFSFVDARSEHPSWRPAAGMSASVQSEPSAPAIVPPDEADDTDDDESSTEGAAAAPEMGRSQAALVVSLLVLSVLVVLLGVLSAALFARTRAVRSADGEGGEANGVKGKGKVGAAAVAGAPAVKLPQPKKSSVGNGGFGASANRSLHDLITTTVSSKDCSA